MDLDFTPLSIALRRFGFAFDISVGFGLAVVGF